MSEWLQLKHCNGTHQTLHPPDPNNSSHTHFTYGEYRIFMHLSFFTNNIIVCFHKNMHKTRWDDAYKEAIENVNVENRLTEDISSYRTMTNDEMIARYVKKIEMETPQTIISVLNKLNPSAPEYIIITSTAKTIFCFIRFRHFVKVRLGDMFSNIGLFLNLKTVLESSDCVDSVFGTN